MQLKPQKSSQLQLVETNLTKTFAKELEVSLNELKLEQSIDSYGLDSLRVAKIIGKVESDFKVKLSFEDFEASPTIASLAKLVCSKLDNIPEPALKLGDTLEPNSTSVGYESPNILANSLKERLLKPIQTRFLKPDLDIVQAAPKVVGATSNFPQEYFEQENLIRIFLDNLTSEDIDIDPAEVKRFFTNVDLKGRHFALSPSFNLKEDEALEKGIKAAVELSVSAIDSLLESQSLEHKDISMVVESSLLPATPSIFARVMSVSPFSSHTKRMSLYGVGCMNGVHSLSKIQDYLVGHPAEAVVLISVELASVLWQGSFQKDLKQYLAEHLQDPQKYDSAIKMTLVTAALFGDGAVALLIVGSEHYLYDSDTGQQPQIIDSRSNLVPGTSDLIGVDILLNNSSLRAIVRPEVPYLLPDAIAKTIEPLLEKNNLSLEDISHWILHPGGPKIVREIEARFHLNSEALSLSRSTLSEKGNLSSAHVLYMLEELLESPTPPAKGEYGLMIAMGPGLSQEAILLKF